GQKITLTATVATDDDIAPTGSVRFLDGVSVLATVPLQPAANGVATFSLSSLAAGPHNLSAAYSGDPEHGKSTSSILVQNVRLQDTTTALRSSPNPANNGQQVTFLATVTPTSSGNPTGSVTFRNGGTVLATVKLSGNTATYRTSTLPPGDNAITATYG